MNKLKQLLRQAEFHAFLAMLSLLVFSWPFLIAADLHNPRERFLHLFLPWLVAILVLFLVSISQEPGECEPPDEPGQPEQEGSPDA